MTLPKLLGVADIHSRLARLFTPGLEMRKNLVREMAAKTVLCSCTGAWWKALIVAFDQAMSTSSPKTKPRRPEMKTGCYGYPNRRSQASGPRARAAVEKVRKSLREQLTPKQRRGLMHDRFVLLKRERDLNDKEALLLDGWTKNYPELGAAYRLKERFYAVYEGSGSPEAALAAYEAWNKAVVPEVRDAFGDLIRAFTNWQPWILNYFEHPITNAYTESLNSLIRVMNRLGRGYSFEALRAKILFTEGAHKHKLSRPKFERRREPEPAVAEEVMGYGVPDDAMGYGLPPGHFGKAVLTPRKGTPKAEHPHEPPGPPKNYGADINTLIVLLESGRL